MIKRQFSLILIQRTIQISNICSQLANGLPISSVAHEQVSPVLIIGSGRSGNTLLRSMLISGKIAAIPPESYVWPKLIQKFTYLRFMRWERICEEVLSTFCSHPGSVYWEIDWDMVLADTKTISSSNRSLAAILDKIYIEYSRKFPTVARWGEKTPLNTLYLPVIYKIFPNSQYIHIIRDPRAVAHSYVKASRYNSYISENSYQKAAKRWALSVKNANFIKTRVSPSCFHEIRYEDLINNTITTLESLCSFLGTKFHTNLLDFYETSSALGDVPRYAHHAKVSEPLDNTRVARWGKEISHRDTEKVNRICRKFMEQYGYAP